MERQAAINKLKEIREVAKTYGVVTISEGDSRAIDVVLGEMKPKLNPLTKYLNEINDLMWNTWGVKSEKFDREVGKKIMYILDKWAKEEQQ
jgi:hypothetical protein